jgi:hypothetical protein
MLKVIHSWLEFEKRDVWESEEKKRRVRGFSRLFGNKIYF